MQPLNIPIFPPKEPSQFIGLDCTFLKYIGTEHTVHTFSAVGEVGAAAAGVGCSFVSSAPLQPPPAFAFLKMVVWRVRFQIS